MIITFLIPPAMDSQEAAERTAGCTRMVYPMPNIYELTVAALLEREQFDVRYCDFVYDNKSIARFQSFIEGDASDCYMIWTVNLSLETDLKALKIIRATRPECKMVFMGPGVTYYTAKMLIDANVVVVRGEPDFTVLNVAECFRDNKPLSDVVGISYMCNGVIKHNPARELIKDLDLLPMPARHFIEQHPYTNPKLKIHPYTTVITSRNCPFHCIYCVPSSLTFAREIEFRRDHNRKPPVSFRSVDNVISELEMLAAKGYKSITFIDDNFITTAARLRPIAQCLKKNGIVWGCQSRVDAITDEVAEILGSTGCEFVDLGVESFNDEILKYIKKGITSSQIFSSIDILKRHNVPIKLNILIGTSPLESKETIKDTFSQVKKLGVSQVMFNIVAPFPGTEFYDLAKANGWIVGGDYIPTDVQHHSILNYPNLSTAQMERMLFWNNFRFFLRPSFVISNIMKFDSFTDFIVAAKALKRKLFH